MREPDRLPPRRGGSVRRVLPVVGALAALATAGVMAKAETGSPNPAPTTATAAEEPSPAKASASAGASGTRQVLAPPAGNEVQDELRGKGVLVYRCNGSKYKQTGATVKMYGANGRLTGTQTAPLTWRLKNGTRVDAKLITQQPSGTTPGQALYQVSKISGGTAKDRTTTYIVQLPVSGGLPPATCAKAGTRLSVPVQTRFLFYRSLDQ